MLKLQGGFIDKKLDARKIAVLAADGFEQSELFKPKKALKDVGAEFLIVSLKSGGEKTFYLNVFDT
ncbi:MAG: hypothetical protein ACR2MG_06445 [Pyrinomonadaceae bacterium]